MVCPLGGGSEGRSISWQSHCGGVRPPGDLLLSAQDVNILPIGLSVGSDWPLQNGSTARDDGSSDILVAGLQVTERREEGVVNTSPSSSFLFQQAPWLHKSSRGRGLSLGSQLSCVNVRPSGPTQRSGRLRKPRPQLLEHADQSPGSQ